MMQLFRKFRVWGVSITLFFFVTVFIPGQAKANPLALVPIALIGAALTGSALAGGSYYAPAVYDAAQLAASSVGNVARQVYYGQQFLNSVAGNYFWGKAVSLVAHVGDFFDYLQGIAASIPSLWQQIMGGVTEDIPYTDPSIVGSTVAFPWYSSVSSNPCATYDSTPPVRKIVSLGTPYYVCTSSSNPPSYTSCLPAFVLMGTIYTSQQIAASGSGGCSESSIPILSQRYTVTTTSDSVTEFPTVFNPQTFAKNFIPSQGVTADIDKLANDDSAPPGLITPADTAIPSEAAGGVVTSPPAALTPSDINRGIEAVKADISKKAADTAQQIAATDPTNTVAQQNAADAARRAAEDALKAENEVPELPDISATSEPAYTLPEVDFAARFQTFLANIKSSSVFAVIDNLNLPIGTGQSLISFDFGSWGGVQSLDFADYADAWLILRGVFFAVFCFISTRIVILKR